MNYCKFVACALLFSCHLPTCAIGYYKDIAALAFFLFSKDTQKTGVTTTPKLPDAPMTFGSATKLQKCLQKQQNLQDPRYQDGNMLEQVAQFYSTTTVPAHHVADQMRAFVITNMYESSTYLQESYRLQGDNMAVYSMISGMTDDIVAGLRTCQKRSGFLYFPKESVLKKCLDNSKSLQSERYHTGLIADVATQLASEQFSRATLRRSITNSLIRLTPLLGNITDKDVLNLDSAARQCRTTKGRYLIQKQQQRLEADQRDDANEHR